MIYQGEFIKPIQAGKVGLVDEGLSYDKVDNRALQKIAQTTALPQNAFAAIKANRIEVICLAHEKTANQRMKSFLIAGPVYRFRNCLQKLQIISENQYYQCQWADVRLFLIGWR